KTTMSKDEILQTAIQNVINNLQSKKILKTSEVYKFKVYLEDRDVYLDLSSNILSHVGDAKEELLVIYSFVNTICNLGGVDRVKFLIDGKSVERVKYINLTKFYEKNMEM
ncbi:MAG: GerMN domain-containing protein, partial [Cetobacterium sp.]